MLYDLDTTTIPIIFTVHKKICSERCFWVTPILPEIMFNSQHYVGESTIRVWIKSLLFKNTKACCLFLHVVGHKCIRNCCLIELASYSHSIALFLRHFNGLANPKLEQVLVKHHPLLRGFSQIIDGMLLGLLNEGREVPPAKVISVVPKHLSDEVLHRVLEHILGLQGLPLIRRSLKPRTLQYLRKRKEIN